MKLEIEQTDIEAIANRVAEILKPLLFRTTKDEEKDGLMNVQELAAYMRVSAQCIYKLTRSNQIPHIKRGNKLLLFRKKEIEKWLTSYSVPIDLSASSRLRRKFN